MKLELAGGSRTDYIMGAQWTSHDNGLTWHRFPEAERAWRGGTHMTVVAVDEANGEITVKVDLERIA